MSTRPGLAAPDIQLHFMPYKGEPHGRGEMSAEHGYQIHVCQVRPDSRGTIKLASPDPLAPPLIDPDYLSAPEDARVMVEGIKIARRIGAAPAFAPYRGEERWPGAAVQDDDGAAGAAARLGGNDLPPGRHVPDGGRSRRRWSTATCGSAASRACASSTRR